jgi:hypothetical protein
VYQNIKFVKNNEYGLPGLNPFCRLALPSGEGETPCMLVPLRLPRDTIHKKTPFSDFSIFSPLHTFFGIFFHKIKTYDPDLP